MCYYFSFIGDIFTQSNSNFQKMDTSIPFFIKIPYKQYIYTFISDSKYSTLMKTYSYVVKHFTDTWLISIIFYCDDMVITYKKLKMTQKKH